jgi:hypothetical protein
VRAGLVKWLKEIDRYLYLKRVPIWLKIYFLKIFHKQKGSRKNWARPIQKIGACPGPDPGRWIPCYGNVRAEIA